MSQPHRRAEAINLRAFELLVRQHHRRLLAYAQALAGTAEEAEELVQESFVTAFRNLERFDADRDFGAWVRGIVRMKLLEAHRRRRRQQPVEDPMLEQLDLSHRRWERAEPETDLLALLRACIDRLGAQARRTLELFYFDELSGSEVARTLGIAEAAVRKRLQRCRQLLHECIDGQLEEPWA